MKWKTFCSVFAKRITPGVITILCVMITLPDGFAYFQESQQQPRVQTQETAEKIPPDQLDSLVAPIALYPDPLLAQTLADCSHLSIGNYPALSVVREK